MGTETIASLRRLALDDQARHETPQAACLIAGCLPVVERVAPDRLEGRLALAIASRPPRTDEPDVPHVQTLAILATLVARYDPMAGGAIAQPVFDRVPELVASPFGDFDVRGLDEVFRARAGVDPRQAAAAAERLPDDKVIPARAPRGDPGVEPTRTNTKSRAQLAVAQMLGFPIERRRQEIGELVKDPWLLDDSP